MKEPTEDSPVSSADFMKTFIENNRPPQEAVDHFASIPWTNKWLQSSAYNVIPTFSRHLKRSGEDFYFSRTINTEATIPHMIACQLKDFQTVPLSDGKDAQPMVAPGKPETAPEQPDLVLLVQLGSQGLNGHPGVMHGGVTCALLDESMGLLGMLHTNNIVDTGPRDSLFTANLNVSYRAPIPTPSVVIIKVWLGKRTGRKWYMKGQIINERGQILADAISLWVTTKRAAHI